MIIIVLAMVYPSSLLTHAQLIRTLGIEISDIFPVNNSYIYCEFYSNFISDGMNNLNRNSFLDYNKVRCWCLPIENDTS